MTPCLSSHDVCARFGALGVLLVVLTTACGDPEPRASGGGDADSGPVIESDGPVRTTVDTAVAACPGCRVHLIPTATLGSKGDIELLQRFPMLVRDARGVSYAVPPRSSGHPILVFDRSGTQLRVMDFIGHGPGEFRTVDAMAILAGDSLAVAHDQDRLSVFDPEGRFARSTRTVPFSGGMWPQSLFSVEDGGLVRAGLVSGDESRAPLHHLSREGHLLRSFGSSGVMSPDGLPQFLAWPGRSGQLWVAEPTNYRIERIDLEGIPDRVLGVLAGYGPAFLTRSEFDSVRAAARRLPPLHELYRTLPEFLPHRPIFGLAGVVELEGGFLVVASHRAAEGWEEVAAVWAGSDLEHVRPGEEMKPSLYETQIDVIDIGSGRVHVRERVPGFGQILNDGSFALLTFGDDGLIRAEIHALEVEFRGGSGSPSGERE